MKGKLEKGVIGGVLSTKQARLVKIGKVAVVEHSNSPVDVVKAIALDRLDRVSAIGDLLKG
jgi:hypothetical protein